MVRKVARLISGLLIFVAAVSLSAEAYAEFPYTPEAATTGSVCSPSDSHFQEFRYPEQISYCRRRVSTSLKRRIYEAYGVPKKCRKQYTIDHFYPLSLGGTNRADNLWPEPKAIKQLRQDLETDLFKKLQRGAITQTEALAIISEAKMNPPVRSPSSIEICH